MILKNLQGKFEVTVNKKECGSTEKIGEYPTMDKAIAEFIKASAKLNDETIDPRVVEVFEAIIHPKYKMMRIR